MPSRCRARAPAALGSTLNPQPSTLNPQPAVDVTQATELGRSAIMISLLIGAPVMLTAIVDGLVISIAQAVTQLQDQTLSFVPKIVAMILALLYVLPWIMHQMMDYSTTLIRDIPSSL